MFTDSQRTRRIVLGTLLTGTGVLYLLAMPTRFVTHDAADELQFVLEAEPSYRANHLLLTPTYKLASWLTSAAGFGLPTFVGPQLLNVVAGLVVVATVFTMASYIIRSHTWAALLAIFVAGSHLWFHASTMETGAIATAMLSVAVLIAWRSHDSPRLVSTVGCWLLACASVLFAFNQILLLPILLIALCLSVWPNRGALAKHLLAAGVTSVLVLLLPLTYAGLASGATSIGEVLHWLRSHPDQTRLSDVGFGIMGLLRSFSGFVRLWFATGSGPTLLKAQLQGIELRDVTAVTWLSLSAGVLAAFAVSALCFASLQRPIRRAPWPWLSFAAVSVILLFGSVWLGSDPQFWLPALPFLALMMAAGIQTCREHGTFQKFGLAGASVVCAVAAWTNAPRETPSTMFPKGGPAFEAAERLAQSLSPRDLVLTPGAGWAIYVRHYTPGVNVVNLAYADFMGRDGEFLEKLVETMKQSWSEGGRVYFDGLQGPLLSSQLGYWNMVANARGVERAQLGAFLQEVVALEPLQEGLVTLMPDQYSHRGLN
jgi:hypothetical protein